MKPLRNGNGTASRFGFLGFGTAGSNGNPARRRRWAKPLVQQIEQQQQLDEGDDEDGSSSSSESRISSDDNRKGKGMIASAQGRHGPTMTVDGGRLQLLTADQQQADEATKCSAADNELGSANEFEQREETMAQSLRRYARNLLHFFVEDWFISALLGCITAALSISVDVSYEYLNHYRAVLFDLAREYDKMAGFVSWVGFLVLFVTAAALVCRYVSRQAIGSGIPEVKVIMNGFSLPNYLSFRTLIAKIFSLILTLGSGLPVGKEGPFVHMVLLYTVFFILICVKLLGAIVGHLLSKLTWKSTAFFSNEGREVEILSSGCSVGIACTFSSPAGAVLYGIECTHKYFAVKNYWRAFFATTCSALIFRFANAAIIPPHIAGTITAYYQTSFPNEVFLIEEIPVFVLVGLISGLFGALFVLVHRKITYFKKRNRTFRAIFGRNSLSFTVFMALIVGIVTYPDGIGKFIAGKFTFRETLGDFIANCTMSLHNVSHSMGCSAKIIQRWTIADLELEGPRDRPTALDGSMDATVFMPNVFPSLFGYLIVNFFLVAICITLALPAGIFVPSFVIGACGGRIIGELMVVMFPEGIRGLDGPQIYPGLYAVVGAAAYTGAVTHSLSIAVIVCETTGQLSPLLPVLIALMVANAVSSFLQPSIYESIINIRKYPHLAELPPSRISVHTLKVEQIMVRDVVFITKQTSYKELRELLIATPHLRSYPLVTDDEEKILLGSVARKYLHFLLTSHLGPDPALLLYGCRRRKSRTVADGGSGSVEVNNYRRRHSSGLALLGQTAAAAPAAPKMSVMNERNLFGNTLLSISPLHEDRYPKNSHLAPLLMRQQQNSHQHQQNLLAAADLDKGTSNGNGSVGRPPFRRANRSALLRQPIDLDEVAIDAAPFQLVIGTSLYKVHTLFSLLGLNHAYVTHRGRLVGVVALRELRAALANIYTRGAVPPNQSMSRLRLNSQNFGNFGGSSTRNHSEDNGTLGGGSSSAGPLTQTTTTTTGTTEESPTSTGSGPCFQVERIEEPTISGQPFSQEKGKAQQQDGQRRVEVPVAMLISPPHSSASSSDPTTNMEATTAEEDDPFEPADGQQRPSRKQPEPEELAFPVQNPVEQPPAAHGVGRLAEGQQQQQMRTRAHSDSAELRKRMGR